MARRDTIALAISALAAAVAGACALSRPGAVAGADAEPLAIAESLADAVADANAVEPLDTD